MIENMGKRAKQALRDSVHKSSDEINRALEKMASGLRANQQDILEANAEDMKLARESGMNKAMQDRLLLNPERVEGMAQGLEATAKLPSPLNRVLWEREIHEGLRAKKVSVPLGVIGFIYESRPNVSAEAGGLCFKAGNSVILKGGREAFHSNQAIVKSMRESLKESGFPEDLIQLVTDNSRKVTRELMEASDWVDVLIPRGGPGLIKSVLENARVPVIETGIGNCHLYVDSEADLEKAIPILINAKMQRPSVCNAVETLLVHKDVAQQFLPTAQKALEGVELRGCKLTKQILPDVLEATESDFATEFADLILAIKVVEDLDEAIEHIAAFGTGHSDAILTKNNKKADIFKKEVDSSVVYVNASTRFTDGGEFGFGGEIGISTQKLHARGPMGLEELTSSKYVLEGDGHIRS